MAVFREPDITPNESSDEEDVEEMERSGFEDDTVEAPTTIQSPARWSSQFTFLSLADHHQNQHHDVNGGGGAGLSSSPASTVSPLTLANYLPHEILLHIFRHLSSTRDLYAALLVSRAWCQCSVELLWQKPQFNKLGAITKMISVLGKKDPIFQYATFIRRLNFTLLGGDLTDQYLLRATACTRLERLTLFGCSNVSDEALEKVLRCCPNLVALDITGVTEATDKSIVTAANVAPRLQGVNLGGCKKITDEGIVALATQCTNLRRIKLSGLELITDEPARLLATHCPMLLELDLHNCQLVSDASIREVWTHSTYLREFRLSNVSTLTEKAFPASPNPRPHHLNGGVNHMTLASILQANNIATNLDPLQQPLILDRQFDHLRMLDLTGCANLTDDAMEGIVVNCPKIRNLVLAKCGLLTDEAIGSVCKLGRYLHYLHLGHVSNITDRAVTRLARACTRLRYIDLACCPLLTDMSVFELAVLPKLRRIGLVRVPNLTDQAIYSLGDQQTSLERIHLSYCENISIQAINYLLQRLLKLTHLSLTGIPAFRRPELQRFCRPPPKEFTQNQRAAFCVYSGHGVIELRRYLQAYIQSLTDERRSDHGSGSDSDEPDGEDGETSGDGAFIDLRDDHPLFYPPARGPPANANVNGHQGPSQQRQQGISRRTGPVIGYRTRTHGTDSNEPTPTQASTLQLTPTVRSSIVSAHTSVASPHASLASPLPFPLTAHTSVSNTPTPPTPTNATPIATANGNNSNASVRRSPPTFMSFANAIRGAWIGSAAGPTRTPDVPDYTSYLPANDARRSSGSSATPSRQMPVISSPAPLSAQNVNGNGPSTRQWANHVPTWANGPPSPLPSPSASAAAFAMAGGSQAASSPTGTLWPSTSRHNSEDYSRRDLIALEQSVQNALAGTPSAVRGKDRDRGRDASGSGEGPVTEPRGEASSSAAATRILVRSRRTGDSSAPGHVHSDSSRPERSSSSEARNRSRPRY